MQNYVAHPFLCSNPNEQSLGIVLSWMADNLRSDAILPVLQQHSLATTDPKAWYPTQNLHHVIRDLCKEPDTMNIFVAMGKRFAQEYPFDADIKTLPDAIRSFNQVYHKLHQGSHADEGLLIEQSQPNVMIVTNNTPWPGEMMFGFLMTLGGRFAGSNQRVIFLAPDSNLRTVFEVTWDLPG
jgi:hypothetical protein